jgi:hypothetical protein
VVRDRAKTAAALERVYSYFPILKEKRTAASGTLSGGQLQMVCIGRGLMSSPKMIMLDEPSAALAPQIVMDIFRTIHRITRDGMTVLMVSRTCAWRCCSRPTATSSRTASSTSRAGRQDDLRRQRAPVSYLGRHRSPIREAQLWSQGEADVDYFIDLVIIGLSVGMVYALVALGISLIFSGLDIIHFAHGEIYMLGAFIGLVLFEKALSPTCRRCCSP